MQEKIKWIDTSRTLGALWVICIAHMDEYTCLTIAKPFEYGSMIFLALFMFISGYCTCKYQLKSFGEVGKFYIRRFKRLYPLFLISACLLYLVSFYFDFAYILDFKQLTLTLVCIAWIFGESPSTLWFVNILFFFYFITPGLKHQKSFWKRIVSGVFVVIFLLILCKISNMDVRVLYYFPFYCVGLYADEILGGRIVKEQSFYIVILFMLLSGAFVGLLWIFEKAISYFFLKELVRVGLIWITCFVGVETIIQISLHTPKFLYAITEFISYCSMCMYLFHRQVLATCFYFFGQIPVLIAYLVLVPLIILCSYFIQRAYDLVLNQFSPS